MSDKGDANVVWIIVIIGGFLILALVVLGIMTWINSGSEAGAGCIIERMFGVQRECKVV